MGRAPLADLGSKRSIAEGSGGDSAMGIQSLDAPSATARAVAVVISLIVALVAPGLAQAQAPTTAVSATPEQTADALFAAGDVPRLTRGTAGTLDAILERVLQQAYRNDADLPVASTADA